MKALIFFIVGFIVMHLLLKSIIGDVKDIAVKENKVTVSKCDSIHLANDSLSKELEIANRRVQQYKIGLWFLRDKDKKAYDYVINAGNLNFQNEWR